MKSALQTVSVVFSLLLVVGCGDTPSTPTGNDQASQQEQLTEQIGEPAETKPHRGKVNSVLMRPSEMTGLTPGVLLYFTWDDKPVVVVWSDAQESSCWADDVTSSVETFHGTLRYRTGKEVEFLLELEDGAKGHLAVNNKKYDLAKGALFLLAAAGEELMAKQLSREIAQLTFEREALVTFAKDDADIPSFFPENVKSD